MTIQKAFLRSYRNHEATTLEFARGLTILAGKRGSGKTSVLYAIAAAITGRNALTDARGVGLEEQIRTGEKELHLELALAHGGKDYHIQRTKSEKQHTLLAIPTAPAGIAAQQAALLASLSLSVDLLLPCLDIRPFSGRSAAEQRAEIMAVIQPPGSKIEIPQVIAGLLDKYLSIKALASITEFDTYHAHAFQLRAAAKKDAGVLLVPAAPAALDPEAAGLEEVEADLEAFRKDSGALQEEKGGLTAQAKQFESLKAALVADASLLEQLRDNPPVDFSGDKAEELEKELEGNRKRLADVGAMLAVAQEAETAAKEMSRLLKQSGPACVGCGRKFSTKTQREDALKEAGIKALKAATDLNALEKEKRELEGTQEALKDRLQDALDDKQRRAQYDGQVEERKAALERNGKRVEEMEAEVNAGAKRLLAIEDDLARFAERITKAGEYRTGLLNAETARRDYDKAVERSRELGQRVSELEALVEWLGPKGGRLDCYKRWVDPFLADLAAAMGKCGLLEPVTLGEDMRLKVAGIGVAHLSGGERLIWEFAYRLALAKRTGLNFVALDSASDLDSESLALLCRVAAEESVQAVVTVTLASREQAWELSQRDVAVLWCEGGKVANMAMERIGA